MSSINPIIFDALSKNNNIVTTSQVLELGFSKQILNNGTNSSRTLYSSGYRTR